MEEAEAVIVEVSVEEEATEVVVEAVDSVVDSAVVEVSCYKRSQEIILFNILICFILLGFDQGPPE